MADLNLPEYATTPPPKIVHGEGDAKGLIIISFGASTICGDREHVHALMMLLKRVLAEDSAP